jgi:hypothetical protein
VTGKCRRPLCAMRTYSRRMQGGLFIWADGCLEI